MKNNRGIRNNNPGNIRRGSSWKGLVQSLPEPFTGRPIIDKEFCQFSSVVYGVRALIVVLRTYTYIHRLITISQIIHRYAPLSENNTYLYIANVVRFINNEYKSELEYLPACVGKLHDVYITADSPVSLFRNPKTLSFVGMCLVRAICKQETGFHCSSQLVFDAQKLI